MRRAVAGVALAVLLVAALIAFARYGTRPSPQSDTESATDPARIAAQIPAGFQGDRQIGDWKLSCGPEQEAPKTRGASRKKAASPEWKIPRCRIFAALADTHKRDDDARVTFRRAGLNRTLSIFVRFPPTDVRENDKASLRADKFIHVMAVRRCTQEFCLVREAITKADLSALLAAKAMVLQFTSRASGKHVARSIPTVGFADAIRGMLRIDR